MLKIVGKGSSLLSIVAHLVLLGNINISCAAGAEV